MWLVSCKKASASARALAIVIPCLQSDDSASQGHSLRFFGKSKNLHDYFIDAMYYEYDLLPSSYFIRGSSNNCNNTAYVQKAAPKKNYIETNK